MWSLEDNQQDLQKVAESREIGPKETSASQGPKLALADNFAMSLVSTVGDARAMIRTETGRNNQTEGLIGRL